MSGNPLVRAEEMRDLWKQTADGVEGLISHVDGLESALGTPADEEATTGNGSTIGLLKRLRNAVVNIGAAVGAARGVLVAGSDGANARALRTNANGELLTQLTGSNMEYYGATVVDRPAANSVRVGAIYMAVRTQEMWQSDGTDWVVIM